MRQVSTAWIAGFLSLLWLVMAYDLSMLEMARLQPPEVSPKSSLLVNPDYGPAGPETPR